jgi:hypothetical protein
MKFLTVIETKKWLKNPDIFNDSLQIKDHVFANHWQLRLPGDSGKKTAVGRELCSLLCSERGLLWINEFGIWPSSEDWNLFDKFRRSLNETRYLSESPGHLFDSNDSDDVTSL